MSRRLTIEQMQRIANEHGGKCLSDTYVNNRTKLRWRCAQGHEWEATPFNIKQGNWCPDCYSLTRSKSLRLGIEAMQRIANERGGKCLSDTYINAHTKLRWRCAEDHEWEATPSDIKQGSWCRVCAGTAKLTIDKWER